MLALTTLGIGILQLAYPFPDYGAGRVVIDGAFSADFHAWGRAVGRNPGRTGDRDLATTRSRGAYGMSTLRCQFVPTP